ncbi:hypothetical protein NECID01_1685 [Nematocida sp. AWRm77]|nr:hypothetical protein NECID01_1685 [Nematocida sp. AWRm77]
MAGVNGYFNGKYVPKREGRIVLLSCSAAVVYILFSYSVHFYDKHHPEMDSAVLEMNKYLFISHMNSAIINALLIMEGFMARNIVQIVLTTLVNLVLFISMAVSVVVYSKFFSRYIYLAICIANILFSLYILFLAFGLRKEFGWFYYKVYGSDPMRNKVCTVRKTQSVLMRLTFEVFLSFWLFNMKVTLMLALLLGSTAGYYITTLLYTVESRYESYVLRTITIILCLFILAYLIVDIPLFVMHTQAFNDAGKSVTYHIPVLTYLALRILIMLGYITALVMDTVSFSKGFHGYYTQRQRRRAALV